MKISLTGPNGFLGTNLRNYLKDDLIYSFDRDICNKNNFTKEFFDCDLVIHLAGKNKGTDQEILDVNFKGTLNLIELCVLHQKPIIIAGTDYQKNDVYKLSKDLIKQLCKAYSYYGLHSLVLNLPKIFGPYCKPNYNSFVSTLIYSASLQQLEKEILNIHNIDEQIELIYIDDVCKMINQAIKNGYFGDYKEFDFRKQDGKFIISFREIINILYGNKVHPQSEKFITTLNWYKNKYQGSIYA